jgi:HNH endonuclease
VSRFWTCHWQFRYWRPDVNNEGGCLRSSGGNLYSKRGIRGGDSHKAYIVSLSDGQLYLGGRMTVSRIVSRDEAVRIRGSDRLFPADEWLIDDTPAGGTPLHLHRRLDPAVTRQVRCIMADGEVRGLFFVSDTHLDVQATRGVRELVAESAELLDRIISITDAMPRTEELVTVSEAMIRDGVPMAKRIEFRLPDEIPSGMAYNEGSVRRVDVNRYERDPRARLACIAAHGANCCICGFDFGMVYGAEAEGYIHVHHLRPLSEVGGESDVDPVEDLRPVCPNCHAVLHLDGRCRTIEEVKQLLHEQR